ncbi:80 kDa protein [Penicillium janczewskii chrysovirus 1]|uniref:80 kDa protein n=1 Tax=Penicillium janczewskii chrysovirus 1 TaxID=1755792 RepID=A0A0S2KPC2_9VIRU|nr:80 kDa protein [Penicillium janczewskii chrysovirus 1]ALO50144.1 80 kDa protein [Penicillium janczewskii chrysovirus 1]
MSNHRAVSWADEMESEGTFSPPEIEYANTSAGYLAGLAALGDASYDEEDEEIAAPWLARRVGRTPTPRPLHEAVGDGEEELPTYVHDPPSYEDDVYDDEAADVGTPILDALYGLTLRRLDDNSAGAQEGTRLQRSQAAPPSCMVAQTPHDKWWQRESYGQGTHACLNSAPLHSGVPYGDSVRGANWTDSQLKVKALSEQNRYHSAFRKGSEARGAQDVNGADGVVTCWWKPNDTRIRLRTEFYFCQADAECSVYVDWERRDLRIVTDIYVSCSLDTMRARRPDLAERMNLVLSAFCVAVMEEDISVESVLQLDNSSLKDMKKLVVRTQHGSKLQKRSSTVAHALSSTSEDLSGIPSEQHVDFSLWQRGRGVYYGRLRASDVPPAQLVLLAANGGLSVSGSLLVVRAVGTNDISLVCSSSVANYTFRPAMVAHKHAPCVRDGLMSPIACVALHGDASGVLSVTVDGERTAVETILTDAMSEPDRRPICTLDLNGTRTALRDLGLLCGYAMTERTIDGEVKLFFSGHGREFDIRLLYGTGTLTRWENLLGVTECMEVDDHIAPQTDSEIGLDWGASGLGRYMLAAYTQHGIIYGKKIMVAKRGPFSALSYDDRGRRRIIAPSAEVYNYVIDTEYINVKRGDELLTYVYAVGIAKFSQGAYVGSWVAMDLEENSKAFLSTLSAQEAKGYSDAINKLREEEVPGVDMVEVLLAIRERLLTNPNTRIYAKGREAEQRLMTSSVSGGTRMFRAQAKAAGALIRELGPLLPKYDSAARAVGWSTTHNPAREATLFGYLAGLCAALPGEQLVGRDGLGTIMPSLGGTQM